MESFQIKFNKNNTICLISMFSYYFSFDYNLMASLFCISKTKYTVNTQNSYRNDNNNNNNNNKKYILNRKSREILCPNISSRVGGAR